MGQNFSQLVVKEYVDTETGEILSYESQKTFTQKIEKDKFYITYIDFIAPFFKLKLFHKWYRNRISHSSHQYFHLDSYQLKQHQL